MVDSSTIKPFVKDWINDPDFATQNIHLYASEAIKRDELVSNVKYELIVKLFEELDNGFMGKLTIKFDLKQAYKAGELFLDFHGQAIADMQINGASHLAQFKSHRVQIPEQLMKVNETNTVSFWFKNNYVSNSAGLHYFKDPRDDLVYIYSHLEPFFCHRFFPSIDQPSIRAPINLTVVAKEKWQVIANGSDISKEQACLNVTDDELQQLVNSDSDCNVRYFKESPPISTYIYALCAGNYAVIQNQDPNPLTPMRIFVRQTKKDFIDSEELFRVVKAGMNFYGELFGTAFPFEKYDHIFCPEFRINAMENVGAITFTDNFLLPKDQQTDHNKFIFMRIVLHELAHMWFGDLTTMQWWNDLWLKESFADFSCATVMENCEELSNYQFPQQIFLQFIQLGLEADLAPSTHPIQGFINHTGDAVNAFDGISYRKGASFVKTMKNFIGKDALKQGLNLYCKKYAYKNTTQNNLIECLNQALSEQGDSDIDLIKWTDSWTKTSGTNTMQAVFDEQTGNININLEFPHFGDKVFHEQKMEIGLLLEEENQFVFIQNVHIKSQEQTQSVITQQHDKLVQYGYQSLDSGFKLLKKPKAILVNANNKGYCRVKLDQQSVDHFSSILGQITDDTNRCYLWQILVDHVSQKVIKPTEFLNCVSKNLKHESKESFIPFILSKSLYMINQFINIDQKQQYRQLMFDTINDKLAITVSNKSVRTCLIDYLIAMAPYSQLSLLEQMLKSQTISSESDVKEINKLQRYSIIQRLAEADFLSSEQFESYQAQEKQIDFSNTDLLQLHRINASQTSDSKKQEVFDSYLIVNQWKQKDLISSTGSFYNRNNVEQSGKFADQYFEKLDFVHDTFHGDYFKVFFTQLNPSFLCRQGDLDNYKQLFAKYENTDKTLFTKLLKEIINVFELTLQIKENQ